ncbi:MAG TPA: alpha-2-macroglobulin family protein, partial [Polyangiaceae bacterium]|nr:alpha-2-macroglobulin family protein [Polyangiaceae bacterium]
SAMPMAAPPPRAKSKGVVPSEADSEGPSPSTPIAMRTNFNALAAFVPRITTDARGHAEARVKLPDNLTRYRIMAVAAANQNQFGSAESDVTARLPLMVRPSAPRFLNFGDRAELPVVLQNQTAEPMTVDVALRVDNLKLFDPNGRRLVIPAADRVELRFPIAAAQPGTARAQVGATGRAAQTTRDHTDAAEIELPVWTPATTEAFATYGVVDQGAVAQPVRMPSRVVKEFGGLDITTSSTALQGLSDAVLYIVRYPFDCNEQIASRLLTIAALRDVLTAFSAEGLPKPELLEKTVALDVQKLADRQTWSGGWDYWRKDRQADPFVSVHVAHALVRARAKGYKVPEQVLQQALAYLAAIQHRFPAFWPPEARRAVEAYALDVRRRAGNPDPARARALVREAGGVEKMPLEALGWLLPLFAKDAASAGELRAVRRHLDNRVTETAGKAHFVTSYGDGAHLLLHSDRRADGILLDAFFDDRPESDVIPKIVAGLLADRKRGRWYNTQENVFILLGLDRYFQAVEKATPDFVARAWLGSAFAGEHAYRGRTNDRKEIAIPLAAVASIPQPSLVTLSKEGTGRLYYRIGMRYAPEDLRPPPAEHGFSVTRRYESTKDPADVKRDADGTWRVRAGALVRVRVSMVAPARRYHVALVDPLPAGFEPLNAALATTATIPRDPDEGNAKGGKRVPWWWSSAWYEHQNLRDERVEAFASLLWEGVYDYTYVARATTPGDFVVPPPKAEEMYDPETFGRGPSDRVVVY